MPEQSIHERLDALLGWQDDEAERALLLLYGELPAWFPLPSMEHPRRIVYRLGNKGFTAEQIATFVTDYLADKPIVQGAMLSGEFIGAVSDLAHITYALSLPGNECLEMLAGALAATGKAFRDGRKMNTSSPIRKAIAHELKKQPNLKPREMWVILASKPPKGWEFFSNNLGKYIEGPTGSDGMKYTRFSAVCKEEKDKLSV